MVAALSIDPDTGLDPPGFKVRAAQGLDAAVSPSPFMLLFTELTCRSQSSSKVTHIRFLVEAAQLTPVGYWVWQKIVENLAASDTTPTRWTWPRMTGTTKRVLECQATLTEVQAAIIPQPRSP